MEVKEILKEKIKVKTDTELGEVLGIGKTAVSGWKKQGVPKYITALLPYISNEDDFVLVPRYDVAGSCGGGALVDTEEVVEYLSFRREWIKNSLRIGEKDLAVISVIGDSMEPRLHDGDVVLLDTSKHYVEDNGIYALQFNGGLSIKRVQRFMSGALEIISDNKTYKPEMIPPEQSNNVRVVGRVVWAGGKV